MLSNFPEQRENVINYQQISDSLSCLYLAVETVLEESELRLGYHLTVDDPDVSLAAHIILMLVSRSIVEPQHQVMRVNERSKTRFVKRSSTDEYEK